MKQKLILTGIFLFACFLQLIAQQRTVTGTVTSSEGIPLVDASVTLVGQTKGVTTGPNGTFSISVPTNAKQLQISYVGAESKTVDISSTSNVTVTLQTTGQSLTDIVVVGYGSVRKKDLTGAVSSIKAEDFNRGVIHSADQLLQGKVAGLEVTNTSGQPGAATTIQIRGSSSIRSSNNPLYVVDGVPLDGGTARPDLASEFGTTPQSDPLLFLNPNDIAQIDVLKDASATAIYGSRGANGVIIITTKKGSTGPMKIDVGASLGVFAGYMKKFEILSASQFRDALNEFLPAARVAELDGGESVDALEAITQSTVSQNYSLALSGGNDNGKFRASFLASDNQGFLKKSSLEKYLASFNGQYLFLDDKLTTEFGLIAANYGESLVSVANTSGSTGNLISSAVSWNPTMPFMVDGKYNFPTNGSGNPLAFGDSYSDISNVSSFLGHISAAYKITPKLEYKFLYGINYGTGNRKLNIEGWLQGFPNISGLGNAAIAHQKLTSQVIDHTLNYKTDISENISVDALIGYEFYKTDVSGSNITANGFNTNLTEESRIDIPYTSIFQNAKTQNPLYTFANPTAELQSYFGRATFNYKDRYLITGTLRSDGSSKFGENNKYSYFPSVGFKWQINNENFMEGTNLFSNLGLRLSYGLTGNQEFPAGSSKEQFSLSSYNTAPQIVNGNANLKWETTKQFNAGLDFIIGSGNVYGSIDYYKRNTSDILFQTNAIQPAPSSLSFINLPNANLVNSGVELALGATLVRNSNFSWEVSGNASYNKNIIKNFTDPNTGLDLMIRTGEISGQGVSGTLAQVITNNRPVNVFYLKPFEGFDESGNQIIGTNPDFAGDPNPSVLAGFSTYLKYKKLSLGINMGGAFGFLIYNNTATSITNIFGISNGRNIDLAAYNSDEQPGSGVAASDRFLEKGNYFKLRNVTLTYSVGNAGKYLKNINAYISGSNLFVLTKFSGFDPEVNIDKSNNSYPSRSIEYVPYPTPRTITFGLNFSL